MRTALHLAWIAAVSAAAIACSHEDDKRDAWSCAMLPVPGGGERVTCVSTGLTSSVDPYVCAASDARAECPPPEPYLAYQVAVFVGGGTSDGAGSTSDGPPIGITSSSSGTTDGTGGTGTGGGICDYCPDCTGCGGTSDGGGGASGGTGGTTTSGAPGNGSGNGNGNGNASSGNASSGNASSGNASSGNASSGGASSGGASSGGASSGNASSGGGSTGDGGGYNGHGPGSSGGNGNGNAGGNGNGNGGGTDHSGGGWQCAPDASGNTVCTKPPVCLPGTHPSACGACVPNGPTPDDCTPPGEGGCWVTGGGFVVDTDGKDSFGGNAMPMKSGTIRGEWEHQDHGTQSKAHGQAQYLVCRHVAGPGPGNPGGKNTSGTRFDINQVYFGGDARYFTGGAWEGGYWFDVVAEDHGEPGNLSAHKGTADHYHFTLRKIAGANQSGTVVYETKGDLVGGNIQIHPSNNGHPTTSSALPAWVSLEP
jgi:hypothetical protein